MTLAIALAFLLVGALAAWRGARPPDLAKGVRMIPWRGVMVFSAAGVLLMTVHLLNLLGLHTGR